LGVRARIRTQAYLVGVVPLVFLILLLVLGLAMQRFTQAGAALEQRAQVALGHVDQLRAALGEANRAATTGPPQTSAQRLAQARSRIEVHLHALQPMVPGDARASFAQLTGDLHVGLNLLDRYAALVRANHTAEAGALSDAPSTRALSQRLRHGFDDLVNSERRDELSRFSAMRGNVRGLEISLIASSVLGILLTLIVAGRFGFGIAERLGQLAENARHLAHGDAVLPLRGDDEFSDLDVVYQAMMRQIRREQQLNSRLQGMLLPQQLPYFDGIRIDTSYVPAAQESEVGGDWYDAFLVGEHSICISMGDVAGHGLRAAAVMASARLAVRTAARMQSDPGQIVAHLNRVICADEPDTLVTAVVALLDTDDGTLSYAVAGHPEPMLISADGEIEFLGGNGLVLGAETDAAYETFQTRLHEGSALLLYTDGLIELTRDYFAGVEELRKAASKEFASSAQNIAEAIQQRVFRGRRADDDAALLFVGVTRLGSSLPDPRRHDWTLDARDAESAHRAKRAILWHLGNTIRDEAQLASIELVLGELIGNVARHSPGIADVSIERIAGRTLLRVIDRGEPFTYKANGATDLLAESGRGLFLVRAIAQDLRVQHDGRGNVVTAVLSERR
jgi:serine phosphatase RsbU (regulator of sigma subunit)/anti-sigma regulatory factor (Ser/Thr protein kinase)